MSADLILTIYADDDVTPYVALGTAADHANPYLQRPDQYAEAEIDLVEGRGRIGRINVRVIDPQNGATQADRFITALLGSPDGYSKINGRRAKLETTAGVVVQDGICAGATLSSSYAGFEFALEDFRARGIKFRAFDKTGTTTVLPRGVLDGWGKYPNGKWFVPPTKPLVGTFTLYEAGSGAVSLRDMWISGGPGDPNGEVPSTLVVTSAMYQAMLFEWGENGEVKRNVEVRWRAVGASTWNTIVPGSEVAGQLTPLVPARFKSPTGEIQVQAARDVNLIGSPLPADGQEVEVVIVYTGAASETFPFHFDGTWGEYARNLLRGDYSVRDPRIPFNEAALLAIDTPALIRQKEPVDDLREHLEALFKARGGAPGMNTAFEVVPVLAELPDSTVVAPVLDNGNCEPIPGWEHPITDAVTVVDLTYPRYVRVSSDKDPLGERSGGDGISVRDQPVRVEPIDGTILNVVGEQVHEVDAFPFGAIGGADGEPVTGDAADETGFQIAYGMGHALIDRLAYGGQTSFVRARRSDADVAGIKVGDWVIDRRTWAPNYQSGKRGRDHLAQVLAVRDLNPAWREMRILDAAPYANALGLPSLGTVTADAGGVVSVPVTAIPAGTEVRADYAVSATEPAATSGLWTFLGRTGALGTLKSPPLPAGVTVWVRGRSEAVGRRPSAWTARQSVVTPSTARLTSFSLSVTSTGVATASWQRNDATLGVRLYYQEHAPDADPAPVSYIDVDASLGEAQLPGTVTLDKALTVDAEPYTGWTGSAVSGTAGEKVRDTKVRRRSVIVQVGPRASIQQTASTSVDATYELSGALGEGGVAPLEWQAVEDDSRAPLDWPAAWQTAPLPVSRVVNRHVKRPIVLHFRVRDGDGRISVPVSRVVDPILVAIKATDGRIEDQEVMSGGQRPFRRGVDALGDVMDDASYRRTGIDYIDASNRIANVYRGALVEPVGNLFKRNSDTFDDVGQGTTYHKTIASYIDASSGKVVKLLRASVDEIPDNLFKLNSNTLDQVVEGATYKRATQPILDQAISPTQNLLGPGHTPRDWNANAGDTFLFSITVAEAGLKEGEMVSLSGDILPSVSTDPGFHVRLRQKDGAGTLIADDAGTTVSGGLGRSEVSDPIASGAVTLDIFISDSGVNSAGATASKLMLNRGPVALPFEEPPLRPNRENADVLTETADRSFTQQAMLDGSRRIVNVYRSTLTEPVGNLFKLNSNTFDQVGQGTTYHKTIASYIDASSGKVVKVRRAAVDEIPDNLFKLYSNTLDQVEDGGTFKRPTQAQIDQAVSPTQNLLGPDASPARGSLYTYYSGTLEDLRLAPGDVISWRGQAKAAAGTDNNARIRLQAKDGAGTVIDTMDSSYVDGTGNWEDSVKNNYPIPNGTVSIALFSTHSTASGGLQLRRVMLNRGPVALPFEEPSLRPNRAGVEQDAYIGGTRAKETIVADRQLHSATVVDTQNVARGLKKGSAADANQVTFGAPAFSTTPHVWFGPGGLSYNAGWPSVDHGPVIEALNLDANGFKLRAILRQAVGAVTAREALFSGDTATKGTTPEAWDDVYTFRYSVTVNQGVAQSDLTAPFEPSSITLYFYTNDGSGDVLRATRTYSNDTGSAVTHSGQTVEVTVDLMGLNDTFRIVVAATEGNGGSVSREKVTWGEAGAPAEKSMGTVKIPFTAGVGT